MAGPPSPLECTARWWRPRLRPPGSAAGGPSEPEPGHRGTRGAPQRGAGPLRGAGPVPQRPGACGVPTAVPAGCLLFVPLRARPLARRPAQAGPGGHRRPRCPQPAPCGKPPGCCLDLLLPGGAVRRRETPSSGERPRTSRPRRPEPSPSRDLPPTPAAGGPHPGQATADRVWFWGVLQTEQAEARQGSGERGPFTGPAAYGRVPGGWVKPPAAPGASAGCGSPDGGCPGLTLSLPPAPSAPQSVGADAQGPPGPRTPRLRRRRPLKEPLNAAHEVGPLPSAPTSPVRVRSGGQ